MPPAVSADLLKVDWICLIGVLVGAWTLLCVFSTERKKRIEAIDFAAAVARQRAEQQARQLSSGTSTGPEIASAQGRANP